MACVGLCGTRAKSASRLSDVYVASLSMGKVRKGDVRSLECEVWSVKCGVWSAKCGVRSVECEGWRAKFGV